MTTTNLRDQREVDRAADHFVTQLAGLELLGQAAAAIVEWDDALRKFLTDTIVHAAARAANVVDNPDIPTDSVTAAALEALTCIEDDDLENPVRDWILQCPRIIALTSRLVGRVGWESMDRVELLLPSHGFEAESCLTTGSGDDCAHLTVTHGLEITTRLVRCPAIIKEAFDIAVND
jgi:hypothetical protein